MIKVHNGTMDDTYVREKPPKLGKSPCRKFGSSLYIHYDIVPVL